MRRLARHGDGGVRKHCEHVENAAILLSAVAAMTDADAARRGLDRKPYLSAKASAGKVLDFHSATFSSAEAPSRHPGTFHNSSSGRPNSYRACCGPADSLRSEQDATTCRIPGSV